MLRLGFVVLAVAIPLLAGALPLASVNSAVGEADVRNATEPAAWMPQLPANLVFQEVPRAMRARSFIVPLELDAVPLSVDATSLRPGETQLVFSGAEFVLGSQTSFLSEVP